MRLPPSKNLDPHTVRDFGKEWKHFDQTALTEAELREHFDRYFRIFPWTSLPEGAVGFDMGCGSGRWAKFVAPRVGVLHCIDASEEALSVARITLSQQPTVRFHLASVDALPLEENSMDFGYSLGVLHHVPDPLAGMKACVSKLRPGAPFLVYLYYALENRPFWFRALWRASDVVRRLIAPRPHMAKVVLTFPIAILAYWPLSRLANLAAWAGFKTERIPLSYYRSASFYTLRTDALDRFGTRLEQRFTSDELRNLMTRAGLTNVVISDHEPYWCAVGARQFQS